MKKETPNAEFAHIWIAFCLYFGGSFLHLLSRKVNVFYWSFFNVVRNGLVSTLLDCDSHLVADGDLVFLFVFVTFSISLVQKSLFAGLKELNSITREISDGLFSTKFI
jgi:hypothetical protein